MKNSQNKNGSELSEILPQDIHEDLALVEEKLRKSINADPVLIEKIGKHVLDSGGKRLRPILHLLSARMCEHRSADSVNVAACAELAHTATLLHDDVIDSALTRRGKPSANVLWGNKQSILVGDYIFSQCFTILVEIKNLSIMDSFARVFCELSTGEMLELINEHNLKVSLESYFEVIRKKTSSLFKLCLETAPLLNVKKEHLREPLSEFGMNFGIMFQLIDDYLDYFGDTEKMGKPTMSDFKEKKVTFPLIHLKKICTPKELESISEIFYQLTIREPEEVYIKGLMEKYAIDGVVLDLAKEYNAKAYANLKDIGDSPHKKVLLSIMEHNLTRDR